MKTIWKYELEPIEKNILKVPRGGKILSVNVHRGFPCLWVEVDSESPKEERIIEMFDTGHEIPSLEGPWWREFIGTVVYGGYFVSHVYESFGPNKVKVVDNMMV